MFAQDGDEVARRHRLDHLGQHIVAQGVIRHDLGPPDEGRLEGLVERRAQQLGELVGLRQRLLFIFYYFSLGSVL